MLKIWVILLLLIPVLACKQEKTASENQPPAVLNKTINEDELVLRLSADLIPTQQTIDQQEQNEIINYAIDQLLDVQSTASGLYYQIIRPGAGDSIRWADRLAVHYRGFFLDGTEFDSSYKRTQAIEFYVGNMIPGWNEGLQLLKPGGKVLLLIPSRLGYGEKGLADGKGKMLVPPNSILAFELEVVKKL